MRKLTFHFGLWKTGTTFLQKKVFHGKGFGGKHNTASPILKELHFAFINGASELWETDYGINLLGKAFRDINVFSAENYYRAKLFLPGAAHWNGTDMLHGSTQLRAMRRSLEQHFGIELRLFFFFRRQAQWLASMYSELSQYRLSSSTADFENYVAEMLRKPYVHGDNLLHFDVLLSSLKSALGDGNVMCAPYELFSDKEVWERLLNFMASDIDLSEIDFTEQVNAKSNKASAVDEWNLFKKGQTEPQEDKLRLNSELEERVKHHYAAHNKRLASATGFDLKSLGYW